MQEVNDDLTAIRILRHESCLTLIDECESDPSYLGKAYYPCGFNCHERSNVGGVTLMNNPTPEYPLKIFSHAPPGGFERICEHDLNMLELCYQKIRDLLKIEPETN